MTPVRLNFTDSKEGSSGGVVKTEDRVAAVLETPVGCAYAETKTRRGLRIFGHEFGQKALGVCFPGRPHWEGVVGITEHLSISGSYRYNDGHGLHTVVIRADHILDLSEQK